jgi:hypothetical protein
MEGLYEYEVNVPTNANGLLSSPCWLFGEPLRGTTMQPVNGYFLYTLGSIANLFGMADGVLLSIYDPTISRAIQLLTNFKDIEQNIRNIPDSVEGAIRLLEVLEWYRSGYRENPNVVTNQNIRMPLVHSVNRFQTILEQELGKAHTFILEEERGYAPATLIKAVHKLISPRVLPFLSYFTLTNLQDASAALAFDHFTSSGFHTMRAVEDTSRRYFELVTGNPAAGIRSDNKRWYLPLGEIAFKLNELLPKLKSAHTPTGKLPLIVPTLAALCEIYRNPLSHPEIVKLDEEDALDVFNKGIDVLSTMVRDAIAGDVFPIF